MEHVWWSQNTENPKQAFIGDTPRSHASLFSIRNKKFLFKSQMANKTGQIYNTDFGTTESRKILKSYLFSWEAEKQSFC